MPTPHDPGWVATPSTGWAASWLASTATNRASRPSTAATYREAVQAVFVDGGVAGNVVPDEAVLTVNLRIAPDRTLDEGVAAFRELVGAEMDGDDDFEVVDSAAPAAPALDHPLFVRLLDGGLPVRAKLGWTDVSRFAAAGIPALNFGPGDATVAHTADERVERDSIERVHAALVDLLTGREPDR